MYIDATNMQTYAANVGRSAWLARGFSGLIYSSWQSMDFIPWDYSAKKLVLKRHSLVMNNSNKGN